MIFLLILIAKLTGRRDKASPYGATLDLIALQTLVTTRTVMVTTVMDSNGDPFLCVCLLLANTLL